MPPKPKGSVKKKKKKTLVDVPPVVRSLYGPGSGNENPEQLLLEKLVTRADLVFVRLKQADWQYSDFTVMVHASAPLYTLCRKIEEKHGRMGADNTAPNEKNLIHPEDWHLRLDQLGMSGGTVEEQHQAIVYYNYVPATSSALLQREPQLMLHALTAEESEAYHEAQAARSSDHDYMSSMDVSSPKHGSMTGHGGSMLGGVGASVSAAAAKGSSSGGASAGQSAR